MDEGWRHGRIRLESLNPGYPSWDLDPDEEKYRIIAEFVRVLSADYRHSTEHRFPSVVSLSQLFRPEDLRTYVHAAGLAHDPRLSPRKS